MSCRGANVALPLLIGMMYVGGLLFNEQSIVCFSLLYAKERDKTKFIVEEYDEYKMGC